MLLQFFDMPCIHPYSEWVANSSHCLWQFSTSELVFFKFQVGSLPPSSPWFHNSKLPVLPPGIFAPMSSHPPLLRLPLLQRSASFYILASMPLQPWPFIPNTRMLRWLKCKLGADRNPASLVWFSRGCPSSLTGVRFASLPSTMLRHLWTSRVASTCSTQRQYLTLFSLVVLETGDWVASLLARFIGCIFPSQSIRVRIRLTVWGIWF